MCFPQMLLTVRKVVYGVIENIFRLFIYVNSHPAASCTILENVLHCGCTKIPMAEYSHFFFPYTLRELDVL